MPRRRLFPITATLRAHWKKFLRFAGKAPYVKDQSNNAMDPVIPGTATLIQDDTFGAAMTGYMPVPNDKGTDGGDLFKEVFAGKNPFTVEVWVKPSSNQRDYDMFLGKGDSCMGFRIRTSTIDSSSRRTMANGTPMSTNITATK